MEAFDNILVEALDRYFKVLEKVGYINLSDTYKLIVLSFISEFLEDYQGYITEADYATISKVVSCFADTSCLIPYDEYKQLSIPLVNYIYNIPIKVSEDGKIRHTETSSLLRLVNL